VRYIAILLLVAGCAVEPDVDLALVDDEASKILPGDVLLPVESLYACYAVCGAKQEAHCPDWEELPEAGYGACMTICAHWRIHRLSCAQAYTNVQVCRLFSPAPRYTCRADGEPHLTDPTRCQAQERALAACGETIP
jgi:hypothetical protein